VEFRCQAAPVAEIGAAMAAKGRERHLARKGALAWLGKDLTRRAKSKCEICERSGVPLQPYEVPPEPAEPQPERCVLICEACEQALEHPEKELDPSDWRCLRSSLWSEVPAVQVAVVRLLRRLAPGVDWARELLEETYLDEETQAWADAG